MSKQGKLTNKQRAFVEHYLTCWNASEAARRAGYKGRANSVGEQLLSNIDIQAAIERRMAELKMTADEVLLRYAEQARGDYAQYINEFGMVDIGDMVRDKKAYLIKKIKPTKEGLEVEFYDSQTALAQLGKHLGLMTDRAINIDIDVSNLDDRQLERIAAGEDPLAVLADKSAS